MGSDREARLRRWLLAACACLGTGSALASAVLDRGSAEVGFSTMSLGGQVAVNGDAGIAGTRVDLDRDLDVGGRDRSRMYALRWRPYDRHEFALRQQSFTRLGERTITRDIVFDGQTFNVNSHVRGQLDLQLWSFDYLWWWLAEERYAFGLSAGALHYQLGMTLKANNLPGGGQTQPLRAQVSEDLPVLVLGAEYRQALGANWRLLARAAVFKASVGHVDGTVYNLEGALEYALSPHATLALRYVTTRLDASAERVGLDGQLALNLAGLQTAVLWRW